MLALLALLACKDDGSTTDDSATDDTSVSTDDSATDDTATDDTGEYVEPDADVSVSGTITDERSVAIPSGDITVAILETVISDAGATFGTMIANTTVSGLASGGSVDWELTASKPDASMMREIDTGVQGASFIAVAWADDDADGMVDEGETLVGADWLLLVWLEGPLSSDRTGDGFAAGWNTIEFDITSGGTTEGTAAQDGALGGFVVDTSLLPVTYDTLAMNFSEAVQEGSYVGLVHSALFDETADTPEAPWIGLTAVAAADAPVSYDIPTTGAVPADHMTASPDLAGVEFSVYAGLAFVDNDADEDFTIGVDLPYAASVDATSGVGATYLRASGWEALITVGFGIDMGWSLRDAATGWPGEWTDGMPLDYTL